MKRALRSRHVGDSDVIRGELTPADLLFGGKEYVVSLPVLASAQWVGATGIVDEPYLRPPHDSSGLISRTLTARSGNRACDSEGAVVPQADRVCWMRCAECSPPAHVLDLTAFVIVGPSRHGHPPGTQRRMGTDAGRPVKIVAQEGRRSWKRIHRPICVETMPRRFGTVPVGVFAAHSFACDRLEFGRVFCSRS